MPDDLSITLPGGFQVPIPKWTTSLFGLVAVVAISFGVYRYFYPPVPELLSIKQAVHLLKLEVQEYNAHILEAPLAKLEMPDQLLRVSMFEDGCIILARKFGGKMTTRLLVDPNRADLQHKDGDLSSLFIASLHAEQKCLNPHPGKFTFKYGEKVDACWVPVVRTFEDSCEHVQMFNTCSQSWATNGDGSPQIKWTKCIH